MRMLCPSQPPFLCCFRFPELPLTQFVPWELGGSGFSSLSFINQSFGWQLSAVQMALIVSKSIRWVFPAHKFDIAI